MLMSNRETTPEQRLTDLVVCDQQSYNPAAEQYYQNGHFGSSHHDIIRPIPGRPGRYQQNGPNGPPPPVPGPKPVLNYLKNDQYNHKGMD